MEKESRRSSNVSFKEFTVNEKVDLDEKEGNLKSLRGSHISLSRTPSRRRSSAFSSVSEKESLLSEEPQRERRGSNRGSRSLIPESSSVENKTETKSKEPMELEKQDSFEISGYESDTDDQSSEDSRKTPARRRSSVLSAFIKVFKGVEESKEIQEDEHNTAKADETIADEQNDPELIHQDRRSSVFSGGSDEEKYLQKPEENQSRRSSRVLQSRSSSRDKVAFKEYPENENLDSNENEGETKQSSQWSIPRTPGRMRSSSFAENYTNKIEDKKDGSLATRRRSSTISDLKNTFKRSELNENKEENHKNEGEGGAFGFCRTIGIHLINFSLNNSPKNQLTIS